LPLSLPSFKESISDAILPSVCKRGEKIQLDVTVGDKVGSLFADAKEIGYKTRVKK
jgi:hypothetical protein